MLKVNCVNIKMKLLKYLGDNIRKFDKSNGLKASRIYSIIEDIEGNILIADQDNGLTIYKGEAFLTVNEKELLPDPNVNAIYQDKSGSIWFGTNNGISRLFPGSDKKPVIYTEASDGIFENVKFFRETTLTVKKKTVKESPSDNLEG